MLIGQVRRADLRVALALLAMAGGAVLGEERLPLASVAVPSGLRPESVSDIGGDGRDVGLGNDAVLAEGRHRRPMRDSRVSRCGCRSWMVCWIWLQRAAPDPLVVVQVRVAARALRALRRGTGRSWCRRPPCRARGRRVSICGFFSISASGAARSGATTAPRCAVSAAMSVSITSRAGVAEHALGVAARPAAIAG